MRATASFKVSCHKDNAVCSMLQSINGQKAILKILSYSQLRIHHVRDPTFGYDAFNAIQQHLMQKVHGVEFNHLCYCSQYTVGGELASHCDNSVQRPDGSWSVATLLIYLNDGYVGGKTEFMNNDRDECVIDKSLRLPEMPSSCVKTYYIGARGPPRDQVHRTL